MAHIPSLEYEDDGNTVPAKVLVARIQADGDGMYVVERVKRGIYSLCKVGSWIGEGDVVVLGKGGLSSIESEGKDVGIRAGGWEWWEAARVDDMSPGHMSSLRRKFDVSLVFGPRSSDVGYESFGAFENTRRSMSMVAPLERNSSSDLNLLTPLESSQGKGDTVMEDVGANDAQQSPQELLDALREQYLQALYISKVSCSQWLMIALTDYRRRLLPTSPKAPCLAVVQLFTPLIKRTLNRLILSPSTGMPF